MLALFAAVLVAFELWAAASHAPTLARIGYRQLRNPGVSVRDADLDPLAYFVSTEALVLARQSIPPDATYTVVLGHARARAGGPAVADGGATRIAFEFWLLPRRYTARLRAAEWVILYRRSPSTLGLRYSKAIGLGPDAEVVEVRR